MKVKEILYEFKKDLLGKTGKQTSILYSSSIISLFLGVFIGIINTRALGPQGYGILAFFGVTTSFTVLFFRFGFFSSSGLLIAQAKEERKEKELTVIEENEDMSVLPKTNVRCPKCGNNEAYWILLQTRAADEPETRIYTCTKCGYRWREY